jgi:hypothetical protein
MVECLLVSLLYDDMLRNLHMYTCPCDMLDLLL